MAKYTPGPWRVGRIEDCGRECILGWSAGEVPDVNDAWVIAEIVGGVECDPDDQATGNALVVAKAPEMLAMLVRVRETCHMSEDPSLGPDIDRLIAEAKGEPYAEPEDD